MAADAGSSLNRYGMTRGDYLPLFQSVSANPDLIGEPFEGKAIGLEMGFDLFHAPTVPKSGTLRNTPMYQINESGGVPVCGTVTLMVKKFTPRPRLVLWRQRAGLAQQGAADKIGAHRSAIAKLESGELGLDDTYRERLAAAYGCQPWQ